MDNSDLNTRLSRIEGGWAIYQWAVGVVSAVIIGGMAIMISFQISGQSELKGQQIQIEAKLDGLIRSVDQLTAKVDQNIALSNAMNGSIREIRTEVINPMATVPPQ
ncbi:hypothetical protein J2766_003384 [Agrobacterium tumefaciens]|uniref:Uncharacterized protein n=1 Tax=Agrobacterium tumefaciens TaxID=358 RepID=A0AAW8LP89_AGRTU|nr:hypothetical protein [Agrobacterium tumefaciens]MBP2566787.1 hypothetical protein [Agrobacterium tumefaciens]MDR6700754.1 hypothetical protein [Agrobacterium tumefaciens]